MAKLIHKLSSLASSILEAEATVFGEFLSCKHE